MISLSIQCLCCRHCFLIIWRNDPENHLFFKSALHPKWLLHSYYCDKTHAISQRFSKNSEGNNSEFIENFEKMFFHYSPVDVCNMFNSSCFKHCVTVKENWMLWKVLTFREKCLYTFFNPLVFFTRMSIHPFIYDPLINILQRFSRSFEAFLENLEEMFLR